MATPMQEGDSEYKVLIEQFKNKDISECFANIHMTFRSKLSAVSSQVSNIDKRVIELEKFAHHANTELNTLGPQLDKKIEEEKNARLKVDLWGRKWNLIIRGLAGKENEKPRDVIKLCRGFFVDVLKVPISNVNEMLFQAAHRLPGKFQGINNIIIRFSSLIDRDEVLDAATKLPPGSGYSVTPDLPPALNILHAKLLKQSWELPPHERKCYKIVYLKQEPFIELRKKIIKSK
ncbi:hypothetical protein FSP39_021600 [Pinctada imbricata]|uniref:Uncharacterized protein n=1 Tax=Pinctada imbricata TaxID=66713 RepID=A0AA88XTN4_PINIB|nr:hypothetical protein FSP39_021600 [Pinctada imbricata]